MEPTLENISDYDTLKGEKKRIVWAVVLAGIIMGSIYAIASSIYDTPQDSIKVKEKVDGIPLH